MRQPPVAVRYPVRNRVSVARTGVPGALFLCAAIAACDTAPRDTVQRTGASDTVATRWNPDTASAIQGMTTAVVASAIDSLLTSLPKQRELLDDERRTRALYAEYQNKPLWLNSRGLNDRAVSLMKALAEVPSHGLRIDEYPIDSLRTSLTMLRDTQQMTAEQLASLDVLLTRTFVTMVHDLLVGQVNPRSVSQDWHIDPNVERVDSAIARTLATPRLEEALASARPTHPDYDALRRELEGYRELAARGGWSTVAEGKALKTADVGTTNRLTTLRARLGVEGFIGGDSVPARSSPPGSDARYDAQLASAVAAFQERHGIVVDSVLGPETVKSLNIPIEYRIGQIAASLERYRWLPRALGSKYVFVNVPAFRLEAYEAGNKALDMKVIVGAEYDGRSTPVFSDSMQTVVFRPYWNVPDGIAENEIRPKIKADPGYLERNRFERVNEGGVARLRQRPGPKNSLGLVKFLFPNDFAVYLHDTPDGELFKEDVRAFSHGCIRVEHPAQLAAWVLGWPEDQVRSAMLAEEDNRQITLPAKIPVYIAYFTAYHENGELRFGSDLYDRDKALVREVARGALPDPKLINGLTELVRLAGG